MPRPTHHLDIRSATDDAGQPLLVLDGDVDLKTADQLRDAVDEAAETATTVTIDLRSVRFMDSPGLGTLIFEAIKQRNYPVVQGCVLVVAVITVTVNLLVDLAYGLADPRIRRA